MKRIVMIGVACASSILGQNIPGQNISGLGGGLDDLIRSVKGSREARQSKASVTKTAPVYPAYTESNRMKIPLRQGLIIVTAINQEGRDFESIKRLTAVSAKSVKMHYSAEHPTQGHIEVDREIRREDLKNARKYELDFNPEGPEVMEGTTALGTSSVVLNELKSRGESAFSFDTGGIFNLGDLISKVFEAADAAGKGSAGNGGSGKLRLVSKTPVGIPVVLNDVRVVLPALHARMASGEGDFYFLDDPDNPLALSWRTSGGDILQAVRISYPGEEAAPRLEQQLTAEKHASVYGIYFDTGSARIRPESEPVLQEIAEVMRKNSAWNLRVEGHTDNIGGDSYNLDLSKQRSAAVRKALIEKYGVSAERLTSTGLGAAKPKAANDSLEGRAQNRRVELIRQS